jgi:hypothetical protein
MIVYLRSKSILAVEVLFPCFFIIAMFAFSKINLQKEVNTLALNPITQFPKGTPVFMNN